MVPSRFEPYTGQKWLTVRFSYLPVSVVQYYRITELLSITYKLSHSSKLARISVFQAEEDGSEPSRGTKLNAGSFNGRTPDSESGNRGSSP